MGDDARRRRRVPPRRGPADWGPDGPHLVTDVLRRLGRTPAISVERQALRIRSYELRHLLVARATAGRCDYDELVAHLRAGNPLPRLKPDWTYALARTVGLQQLEADDIGVAARLLRVLNDQAGRKGLAAPQQFYFAQLLLAAGEFDLLRGLEKRLRGLTESQRRHLDADLRNPAVTGRGSEADWLAAVAGIFASHGLETVTLGPEGPTPFDRLTSSAPAATVSGPLVSVLLTCYRPGPELLASVRSILAQTWADLEVLVVDDASPAEFDGILAACEGLDPRVRLMRMRVNGGTYVARNAGLDAARGEFVTGQDSDDWSHPRRLEMQVAPLLADRALAATRSQCFRVSPALCFTRPGYEASSANGSSLMFRRAETLATAGYFDAVRKGADNEYFLRITHGRPGAVLPQEPPLAFVRVDASTLSDGEFTLGWLAEARRDYRLHYGHWHRRLVAGPGARLPRNPARRPFPAPTPFRRGIPGGSDPSEHYDVVVLGEWQSRGGPVDALLDEVRALAAGGLRVGVAHIEPVGPLRELPRRTLPTLLDLAASGAVDLVQLDAGLRTRLLLLRSAAALPFRPSVPTDLDVGRAVVVVDSPPRPPDGAGLRYTVAACDLAVQDLFGLTPTWAPTDAVTRRSLRDLVDPARLEPYDLGSALDTAGAGLPWTTRRGRRPVLGWLAGEWPATREDVLAAYPADADIDVRIAGSTRGAARLLRKVPSSWLVFAPGELARPTFLRQLDFYVHATETLSAEAHRGVLEAAAVGCLVILPPALERVFGEIAEYAAPPDVRATVRRWYADPDAARARVLAAQAELARRFGPAAYVAAVRRLLESAPASSSVTSVANADAG